MSLAHPQLLWLLAALPLLVAGHLLLGRWVASQAAGVGTTRPALIIGRRPWSTWARRLATWLGLLLLFCAVVGPRWGEEQVERGSRGANIMVLLDCSNSMQAEDCWPDRIGTAQRKALDLLRNAPENRLGLMPFARSPALRCPLTGDLNAIHTMIEDCTPELFPREFQGSSIGKAVSRAVTILCNDRTRGQAILVLSDGADPDTEAVERATREARAEGIPVYGLLLGDPDRKTEIRVGGERVAVPPVAETLDLLAKKTGGIRVSMTNDRADVKRLIAHIADNVDLMEWEEEQQVIDSERYHLFAIAAVLLLALGQLLPARLGGAR